MIYPIVSGCICVSPQNRILCVKGRLSDKWSFPKGHRNSGESSMHCARRELYEETGIEPSKKGCNRALILSTGIYYLYNNIYERECIPNDIEEITETAWLTIKEMKEKDVNIDINTFISQYSSILKTRRSYLPLPCL